MHKAVYALLCVVVFTIPWENLVAYEDSTLTRGVGLAAAALGLVAILLKGRTRRLIAIHYVMALLLGWGILSLAWTVEINLTISRLVTWIQVFGLAWMIWEFAPTPASQVGLVKAYLLGGCFSISTQLFSIFSHTAGSRFTGGNLNLNEFAAAIAISAVMSIYLAIDRTRKKSPFAVAYWAYAACAALSVMMTASRGGLITLLMAVTIFALTFLRGQKLMVFVLAATVAIAAWAFVKLGSQQTIERVAGTGEAIGGHWTLRRDILKKGLEIVPEHWLAGTGAGAFMEAIGTVRSEEHKYHVKHIGSHNAFLDVLVDLGVVGLSLFLTIFWLAATYAWRLPKYERSAWLILIITWCVAGLGGLGEERKHLWLLLGLVTSRYGAMCDATRSMQNMAAAARYVRLPAVRWRTRKA